MAPDILYFLPVARGVDRKYGHEFPGAVLFSVPAAIILFLLWRYLLRDAVIALLPTEEQQKWVPNQQPFEAQSVRAWVLVFVAVAIGIASHILLDSFSHLEGWGVEHVGFLTTTHVQLAGRRLAAYKLVQYFGSLVGLGVLAVWYLWWSEHVPRDRQWKPQCSRMVRAAVLVTLIVLGTFSAYWVARLYGPGERALQMAGAIIAGTRAAFVGLVAFGIFVRLSKSNRKRRGAKTQRNAEI